MAVTRAMAFCQARSSWCLLLTPPSSLLTSTAVNDGGRVDFLNVVYRFDRVEELLHARRVVAFHRGLVGRLESHLGKRGLEARFLERGPDRDEIIRRRHDLDAAVVVRDDVLGARLDRRLHQLVLARAGGEDELAAVLEQERDRA